MPKIADLPEFEGDLVGTELLIVENDMGTKVARVDVLATRAQFLRSVSTTGNMLDEVKALNKLTGAPDVLPVLDADGAVVGCTFPANVAGAGGGIIGYPLKDSATIGRLAGKTILLVGRYVADEGFLAAKGLSDDVIDVGFFAGDYRPGLRHQSQIGTDLLRIAQYQVSGDEAGIGMIARTVPEPATSASALSLRLVSLAYGVLEDSAASLDEMIAAKAAERFGVSLWAEGQPATGEVEAPAAHSHDPVTNYVNGITTPLGANSNGAGVGWYFTPAPEDFALLRGARIRLTCLLDTYGDYDRDLLIVASGDIRADGGGFLTDHRLTSARRYGDGQAHVIEGIFGDGIEQLSVGFNDVSDMVAPRAMGWSIDDIFLEIVATADKRLTGAQATMQLQRNMLARPQRKRKRAEIFIPDDFPDLEQAIAGVGAHQVVNVREGDHDLSGAVKDAFYPTFENIHVRGIGSTKPRLITRLAASTALADVAARSASDFFRSARVENLEIIARNARYGLHLDSSNENRDQHLVFTDVDVTHEGNDDVIAWQAANGGTPNDVWTNCAAVGFGGASGSSCRFDGGRLLGWNFNAFVGHNSPNADAPMLLEIDGYTLDPRAPDRGDSRFAFFFNNLGSGQPDRIRLTGNNLAAPIGMGCWPWFETDPAKIPANKLGNISLTGHGNTPAPYMLIDEGSRALRIRSASEGATSKITVSGAGADILMGPAALRKAVTGAVGLPGSMTGWLDMGDHHVGKDDDVAVTAMRWRLGDRSAAPVPLNVSIDGAAPIAISLNQNFSAMSNEAVCAFLNAALGAGAVAELVNPNDLWRPQFSDEETRVYNAGTTTIRRKRAVAWADSGRPNGRVMTRADAPTDFAGIAYENIKPGETGRVKTGGAVCVPIDIDRTDSVGFRRGDVFIVSADDGRMAVGDGPGILIATSDFDVLVDAQAAGARYLLDNATLEANFRASLWSFEGYLPSGAAAPAILSESGHVLLSTVPHDYAEAEFRASMWSFQGDFAGTGSAPLMVSEKNRVLIGADGGTSAAAAVPAEIEILTDDGQSGSVGQAGSYRAVVYGNAQRQDILTLCRGSEANQWTGNPLSGVAPQLDGASITAIGPLLPQIGSTDTHGTGAAEACVRSLLRASEKSFAIWCDGVGGQPIENLLPNPPEGYAFANYVTRLTRAQALKAPETRLVHRYSLTAHGETGAGDADLGGKHEQLRAAMETQARAILGQTEVLRMISIQPSSFTVATGGVGARSILQYALDHRDAALLICGGPTYHLPWSEDILHNRSLGHAMRGEAGAGIIRRVEAEGYYLPLHLISAEVSGANEITALLSEPALLDQTDSLVAIIANAGVTLIDGTVGNVVVNGDQLIITTTSEAASAGGVDLALGGHANGSSRELATVPRSNIRARRLLGTYSWGGPIKAWACHQSLTL